MEIAKFWAVIAKTRDTSGGDKTRQVQALKDLLSELPESEIVSFDKTYHNLQDKAYHWDLWAAAYIINGGCSDDGFDYFLDWLIAQGQEAYEAALKNPEILKSHATPWDTDFEEFGYVVYYVYEEKFNKPLPVVPRNPRGEPKGVAWEEEDLDAKYPLLTEWVKGTPTAEVNYTDPVSAPVKKSFWQKLFGK